MITAEQLANALTESRTVHPACPSDLELPLKRFGSDGGQAGSADLLAKPALRRASGRSLVLAQSWVPYSVAQRAPASVRQSALRAAQAFTLLSSELATRRGAPTPPLA